MKELKKTNNGNKIKIEKDPDRLNKHRSIQESLNKLEISINKLSYLSDEISDKKPSEEEIKKEEILSLEELLTKLDVILEDKSIYIDAVVCEIRKKLF